MRKRLVRTTETRAKTRYFERAPVVVQKLDCYWNSILCLRGKPEAVAVLYRWLGPLHGRGRDLGDGYREGVVVQ